MGQGGVRAKLCEVEQAVRLNELEKVEGGVPMGDRSMEQVRSCLCIVLGGGTLLITSNQ